MTDIEKLAKAIGDHRIETRTWGVMAAILGAAILGALLF